MIDRRGDAPQQPLPEQLGSAHRLGVRVGRHLSWAHHQGVAAVVEEDVLDPRERIMGAMRRRRWRAENPCLPGAARAVLVLGVQRSGTNMVLRGFDRDPAVEVHNENDRRLFHRYRLRDVDLLRATTVASRHRVVLVKPLCDSHRANELLDALRVGSVRPRALWIYRGVDARSRSAVAKFGDVNRRMLTQVAAGEGLDRWQSGGLSADTLRLIRDWHPASLTPHAAAALFWLVRNRLFFDQELDQNPDVLPVRYEHVVADPTAQVGRIAAFMGLTPDPVHLAHIDARSALVPPVDLPRALRAACTDLCVRLDRAASARGAHAW